MTSKRTKNHEVGIPSVALARQVIRDARPVSATSDDQLKLPSLRILSNPMEEAQAFRRRERSRRPLVKKQVPPLLLLKRPRSTPSNEYPHFDLGPYDPAPSRATTNTAEPMQCKSSSRNRAMLMIDPWIHDLRTGGKVRIETRFRFK